jgi:hypothetical protein
MAIKGLMNVEGSEAEKAAPLTTARENERTMMRLMEDWNLSPIKRKKSDG